MLAGGRLAHADEAAALVHKFADGGNDLLIDPVLGAAEGRVGIADIDDNADVLGDAVASKSMNSTSNGIPLRHSRTPSAE